MNLLRALWRTIRNPDVCTVDDEGQIIECWPVDRREQWELSRPRWTYTFMTRKLPCGCTRRWWGSFALYDGDCWEHFRHVFAEIDETDTTEEEFDRMWDEGTPA